MSDHDIFKSERASEEARVLPELDCLAKASIDIQASSSIEDACNVVSKVTFRLGYYGIQVASINWPARMIEAIFSTGPKWPKIKEATKRSLGGDDILAIQLGKGEPIFIPNSRTERRYNQMDVAVAGLVSQYIVPLITSQSKIGTLQIDCGEIDEIPSNHRIVFDALGASLAFAFEREILHLEIEQAFDMAVASEKQALAGFAAAGIAHQLGHEFEPMHDETHRWLKSPAVRYNKNLSDFFQKLDVSFGMWLETARRPLVFARREEERDRMPFCNAHEVIQSARRLWYTRALMAKCSITLNLCTHDARVLLEEKQLAEVLGCLIVNSIQAYAKEILISTETRIEAVQGILTKCIVIGVTDNGVGIPSDYRSEVFKPDFTTKPEREGTGLGLPIALSIVKRCGGKVILEDSTPYNETKFAVILPILEEVE